MVHRHSAFYFALENSEMFLYLCKVHLGRKQVLEPGSISVF